MAEEKYWIYSEESSEVIEAYCKGKLFDSICALIHDPTASLTYYPIPTFFKPTKIISRLSVSAEKWIVAKKGFVFINSNRDMNAEKKISQWHELFFLLYKIVLMANGNRLQ